MHPTAKTDGVNQPSNADDVKNKILLRRQALEAARATVNYKIKNLKHLFSREQVRCWYIQRDKIVWQLRQLPTEEQLQQGAKRVNYSNSTKYWK